MRIPRVAEEVWYDIGGDVGADAPRLACPRRVHPGQRYCRYRDPGTGRFYHFARPWERDPAWEVVLNQPLEAALCLVPPYRLCYRLLDTNQCLFRSPFPEYSLDQVLEFVWCQAEPVRIGLGYAREAGAYLELLRSVLAAVVVGTEAEFEAELALAALSAPTLLE